MLLVSDEVICAFGRLGHWFGAERYGYQPDIVTMAKGLTSGYSPLGAMAVSDRLVEPFLHGQDASSTASPSAATRSAAAVALANLDVFEKEGILEHVRANEGAFKAVARHPAATCPSSGDVRGAGYFYGIELVKDKDTRQTFDDDESERLLRGFLSGALYEAGLICRADDRGDPVVQLAPPLICGEEEFDVHDLGPPRRSSPRPGSRSEPIGRRGSMTPSASDDSPCGGTGCPGPIGHRPALGGRHRPRRGRGRGWPDRPVDRLLPGRGRPRPAHRRSSSARWSASGRRGATAAGARPSSPPRTSSPRPSWRGAGAGAAMRRAMQATVAEVERVVGTEHIDCDFARGGTVVLARTGVQLQRARRTRWPAPGRGVAARRTCGCCRPAEASAMVGATGVLGGTYTPHCAALDPARLVRGLAEAVERRGVRIYEQTTATAVGPGQVDHRPRRGAGRHGGAGHRGLHPHPPGGGAVAWPRSTR